MTTSVKNSAKLCQCVAAMEPFEMIGTQANSPGSVPVIQYWGEWIRVRRYVCFSGNGWPMFVYDAGAQRWIGNYMANCDTTAKYLNKIAFALREYETVWTDNDCMKIAMDEGFAGLIARRIFSYQGVPIHTFISVPANTFTRTTKVTDEILKLV